MSQSWFYLAGEETIGPISLEQLRDAGAAGLLRRDTRVRQGFSGNWMMAHEVPGLTTQAAAAHGTASRTSPERAAAQTPPPPPSSAVLPPEPSAQEVETLPEGASTRISYPILAIAGLSLIVVVLSVAIVVKARSLKTNEVAQAQPTATANQPAAAATSEPSKVAAKPAASSQPGEAKVKTTEKRELSPIEQLAAAGSNDGAMSASAIGSDVDAGAGEMSMSSPPGEMAMSGSPTEMAMAAMTGEMAGGGKTETSDAPAASAAPPAAPQTPVKRDPTPFESNVPATPRGKIDELAFARLKQLGVEPAQLCTDAVFLRRVYLDLIGTLPTVKEARDFLADKSPDKRSKLIDQLLDRPEFADYWALKWGDLLRVKAEFPINLWPNAAQAYHRWIRTNIKENVPYDRFARELLTASGSNFRVPQVNFYRAMQSKTPATIAQMVALTFLGERTEKWPPEKLAGLAGFFSQIAYKATGEWKEEIVMFDPSKAKAQTAGSATPVAVFPDGKQVKLSADRDPRQVFADWLIDPQNPYFTKQIANRVWYWLLGRGIIHEPDDIRPDNPPQNPELLAELQKQMVANKYDLKKFFRTILNSSTYQLSCIGRSDKPEAANNFATYPLRRLEAEVLVDALCQITGSTETYSSPIPEPFTFIPDNIRSMALPDGSITSSFLEMFGRPPRDSGTESERNNRTTAAQRLHMLNSSHVRRKIEQSKVLQALGRDKRPPREVADELYLMILSRYPTDDEFNYFKSYGGGRGQGVITNVSWALINSAEFLYRH